MLVVAESAKFGWYDNLIAHKVKNFCTKLQINTDLMVVEEPTGEILNKIQNLSRDYDCIIYFSRLGDLQRFENIHLCKVVMSYARNVEMMASEFGTTKFQMHLDLKNSIDELFSRSQEIKINCPLGTNLFGECSEIFSNKDDVSIRRFPMVVHSPISASTLSGTIVVKNFLTSSGSSFYSPSYIKLIEAVKFKIENGLIKSISGNEEDIKKIDNHYNYVSKKYKIDKDVIHSWHCGIHGGLLTDTINENDPDYWSNTVFGNPKYLHFHTCGNYAPGEICLMVENQTIFLDTKKLWDNGKILYRNFPIFFPNIDKWPTLLSL